MAEQGFCTYKFVKIAVSNDSINCICPGSKSWSYLLSFQLGMASTSQGYDWSSVKTHVDGLIDGHLPRLRQLSQVSQTYSCSSMQLINNCVLNAKSGGPIVDGMAEVAMRLSEAGLHGEVDGVRELVKKVLIQANRLELFIEALNDMKRQYVGRYESSEFHSLITEKVADMEQRRKPFDPTHHTNYLDFEQVISAEGNGQPLDEVLDDGIVIEGSAGAIAKNDRCPVTGKEILELEDPVEDNSGFVYEKSAVEDLLKKNNGSYRIVAGSNHITKLEDLKPARLVIIAKRRAKLRRNGTQTQTQDEDCVIEIE